LNEIFVDTGLPPWRAIIDQELLSVGYWTVRWLTFVMFFATGIFLFEILKKVPIFSPKQRNYIVLLFLIIPVNHARIALVMFGYTTSYFLFFLGWMLLLRRSNSIHFLAASFCFFWCFMTHSFLFFVVLPIAHYIFLNRQHLIRRQKDSKLIGKTSFLLLLPIIYIALRNQLWQPTQEFISYHHIYRNGIFLGIIYFFPFTLLTGLVIVPYKKMRTERTYQLALGFFVLGLGVFPYCISNNADRTLFLIWKAEWTSRHQLLMPMGIAILIVAVCSFLKTFRLQHLIFFFCCIFVVSNTLLGAQYFLDSLKKEDLVNLIATEFTTKRISQIELVDDTSIFNFQSGSYRGTEVRELFTIALEDTDFRVEVTSCNESLEAELFVLKSNKSFFSALLSRDLGLYAEVTPCKSK